tara:strand:+ start:64 stop:594 length:531 start_codon:yes stop_codon:yes gene_type:complete
MTNGTKAPRVYVASLADYNAGRLHGVWVTLRPFCEVAELVEHLERETAAMLKTSREEFAEEWAIHDYENFGDHNVFGEYEDFSYVAKVAVFIHQHSDAARAFFHVFGRDDASMEDFDAYYVGEWSDTRAFAEDQAYEFFDMESPVAQFFYWDKYETMLFRDLYLEHDGYVFKRDID